MMLSGNALLVEWLTTHVAIKKFVDVRYIKCNRVWLSSLSGKNFSVS